MLTKKGFTLIEMIFVLSLVCILSLISLSYSPPRKNKEILIEEISSFFLQAKQEAILYKAKSYITITPSYIRYSINNKEKKYEFPQGVQSIHYSFTYNENGHIKTAKTIPFIMRNEEVKFVFQIGSGTFYVA